MDITTGRRIADIRKRRGMTQTELARAAGLSLRWVKTLEDPGSDAAPRTETLRKIATALRVRTTVLQAVRGDGTGEAPAADIEQDWEPVRRALAGRMPQPEEEATPEGVRDALRALAPALAAHRYAEVRLALPGLLRDADTLGGGHESRLARADILSTAGYLLTQTRQFKIAEETLLDAIDAAPDRRGTRAAGAADTLVWLHLRQGHLAEARETAARWADDIEPRLSGASPLQLVLWGRFLLDAANAAVRDNRPGEAEDALRLADAAAAALGRETSRHRASQCVFGPVTTAYIRAEAMVLTGRPDECLAIAEGLPARPPFPDLVSRLRHRLDVANALAQTRQYREAVEVMAGLRGRAPEWIREQEYARDILRAVVDKRRTLTGQMRDLADFIRLPL